MVPMYPILGIAYVFNIDFFMRVDMLLRVLEPEIMDTEEDAIQYNAIPNDDVNLVYVNEVLNLVPKHEVTLIDLGTGTAHIPILFANKHPAVKITGVELADNMIILANENIKNAKLIDRIQIEKQDVKNTTFEQHSFDVVISNSIVHHISEPIQLFAEAKRLAKERSVIYFKDLLRPKSLIELEQLVDKYSVDVNRYQRELFYNSLHAALTLDEVRECVEAAGIKNFKIAQTSDRHWAFTSVNIEAF